MTAVVSAPIPAVRARPRTGPRLGVSGWVSAGFLGLVLVAAVFAPLVAPHSPTEVNLSDSYQGPSAAHWLGADATGRDIASRLIHGAQTSLLGPALIVLLSFVVGIPLALLAAWWGGWISAVVSRFLEVVYSIPGVLLAVLAVSLFGAGLTPAVLSLAIAYLPFMARIVLAGARRERGLPYVQALTVAGVGAVRINVWHILRNLAPLIAGQAAVAFAYALIDLASLSFLGLAVQQPTSDWGVMVADRDAILQGHPEQALMAGGLIVVTVLALFVLGARLSGEKPSLRSYFRRGSA